MENHYNCIYMYVNRINGHKYIGQAKDFNKRHKQHIGESYNKNSGYSYNLHFHRAIRKYDEENFDIIILKKDLKSQCLLNLFECYYIKKYGCLSKENYNIASGGSNGNILEGKTEEEKREIRRKQSEALKGKPKSEEHRQKLIEANKGKQKSEKTKHKISENHADVKGKNNPNLGKLIERWNKDGVLIDIKYQFEYGEMGFERRNVSSCCKGKLKSVGRGKGTEKFIFKYHEE